MRKIVFAISFVLSLIVTTSCVESADKDFPDINALRKSISERNKQKTETIIKDYLTHENSEEYKAQLALTLAEKELCFDLPSSLSDSLIDIAEQFYQNRPTSEHYARTLTYKGYSYSTYGMASKASQYMTDAMVLCKKKDYHKTYGDAYTMKGTILLQQNDIASIEYYDQCALQEYKLANDTAGMITSYINLYGDVESDDDSWAYLDSAEVLCNKARLKHRKEMIHIKRAVLYIRANDLEKARATLFDTLNNVTDNKIISYNTAKGMYYEAIGEYDKTIQITIERINNKGWDDAARITDYENIATIYNHIANYAEAAKYYKLAYETTTKVHEAFKEKSLNISSRIYENEILEQENKNKDTLIVLVIVFCLLVVSVFATMYIRITYQRRNELTSAALRMSQTSQEMGRKIEELEFKLSEIEEKKSMAEDVAKNLLGEKVSLMDKLNMETIKKDVDKIYNNYATNVSKMDFLSDKDKKFCILYKARMSPKVIAVIMDCTASRVYSRKAEINNKAKEYNISLFDDEE